MERIGDAQESFRDILRELKRRSPRRLTNERIAEEMGLTRDAVNAWGTRSLPQVQDLRRLARVLGASTEDTERLERAYLATQQRRRARSGPGRRRQSDMEPQSAARSLIRAYRDITWGYDVEDQKTRCRFVPAAGVTWLGTTREDVLDESGWDNGNGLPQAVRAFVEAQSARHGVQLIQVHRETRVGREIFGFIVTTENWGFLEQFQLLDGPDVEAALDAVSSTVR